MRRMTRFAISPSLFTHLIFFHAVSICLFGLLIGCQSTDMKSAPIAESATSAIPPAAPEMTTMTDASAAAVAEISAPVIRTDAEKAARVAEAEKKFYPHYAKRMALFLDDTPQREPGGVVFLGDSITEGFPTGAAFAYRNVINRGISGDTIEGVRARLDVSVAELRPSHVLLMISINDIVGKPGVEISDMAAAYASLVRDIRAAAPEAELIIQSVLPLCRAFAPHNARASAMNEHLRLIAAAEGVKYIDLHSAMIDENGELRAEYSSDGIHLTLGGYWCWMEMIAPPEDLLKMARGIAPMWTKRLGDSRAPNKVDPPVEGALYGGNRAAEELIVYTPASGRPTTMTNEWGCEAVVENGVVTSAGSNNSPIPANGFVVSGHGEAAQWVSVKLTPGRQVALEDGVLKITNEREAPQTPFEQRRERRMNTMARLAEELAAPAPNEAAIVECENELLALQRETRAAAAQAGGR